MQNRTNILQFRAEKLLNFENISEKEINSELEDLIKEFSRLDIRGETA